MDARFVPNNVRKPTIMYPALTIPVYVTVLLSTISLFAAVILLYVGITYYRSRTRGGRSAPTDPGSTEPGSPVLPFDSAISQSTPDFMENRGIIDGTRGDYGTRSKTVVKQHTFPVMMQRHLAFHRQLSHAIDTNGVESVLNGRQVAAQPPSTVVGIHSTSRPEPTPPVSGSSDEEVQPTAGSDGTSPSSSSVGRLHLTLRYDQDAASLVVRLVRAENLPPRDFSGTADPYVRLHLLPDRKARRQSRLHRKTQDPVFDEYFRFPVPFGSLGDRVLQLSVYDFDRFSRHDVIGVTAIRNILGGSADPSAEELCVLDLVNVAASASLGELLLSLVYLPMAGRLTLNVMKAKNLRSSAMGGTVATNVKVILTCHGKHIKKKKTSGKLGSPNPTYNEAMIFDVPYDNIEEVTLIIRVISQDQYDNSEVIGTCAVGQRIIGVGHDHWTEMLDNPRKSVAQWHRLTERTPSVVSLR